MLRKKISTVLIAIVVTIGIPASAFAATIGGTEVVTSQGQLLTSQVSNEVISTTQSNESEKPVTNTVEQPGSSEISGGIIVNGDTAEKNKDTLKDESGNLPNTEEPAIEEPGVQEPVVEEPVVEEPVVTEPAIVVEEPVVTEPAIVVEPVVTEPAIVVEEVVTGPAIVIEPATLTINYYGEYGGKSETVKEKVEGYNVGDTVDLTVYINKMVTEYELLYTGDIKEIAIDKADMDVTLKFTVDLDKRSGEDLINPEGKDAVDYE